jgi:hypothetical protein
VLSRGLGDAGPLASLALSVTTGKISGWLQVVIAVDFAAFLCAMAFVSWRAWEAVRLISQTLDKVDDSVKSMADWMESLVVLQRQSQELTAIQNRVDSVAVAVVVDNVEIFDPDPDAGETGTAVFTVRNAGGTPVFVLGITRTAEEEMPEDRGRLLTYLEGRDLYLGLPPDGPPLDLAKAAIWYRDLRGQIWLRSLGESQASLVEPGERSLPTEHADEAAPALEAASAKTDLPE